jgi:hypothetical protein
MAVVAGSMAAGVISTMRGSPEKVTSALEVFIPLAQAVGSGGVAAAGKEGLGVVAAHGEAFGQTGLGVLATAGKEGFGRVAAAVVVSSMILYRGLMRGMDQQAKAQQQAQKALNEAQQALLRSHEQALRLAEQAQAGQSSVIKLLEGKLEALQPLARPPSHGDPAQ